MPYEQKRESWQNELNPELELLQLRIDDIVSFVDRKVIGEESAALASLFEKEKNWQDELIEIKSLLDDTTVKARMIEESDYSDVVGNFYNPVFLFFKRIETGKEIKNQAELISTVKNKTADFLAYLEKFSKKEKKAA